MRLSGQQLRDLHTALMSAFPTESELDQFVRFSLDKSLPAIVGRGSMSNMVFELLRWTEARDQTRELGLAAVKEIPTNPRLKQTVAALWPDAFPASQKPADGGVGTGIGGVGTGIHDRVVLELDLVGYSTIARMLQENVSAGSVADLNAQIWKFVDDSLQAVGIPGSQLIATTGDGAILAFESAAHAHQFAQTLHAATERHNAGKTTPNAQRWFRTGAASGQLALTPRPGGGVDAAGIVIADAVRLEAAAKPGDLLIDVPTYNALPPNLRAEYSPVEEVKGKREETFRVHRRNFAPAAAGSSGATAEAHRPAMPKRASRRQIIDLLDKLYPPEKLDTLIFLLEMPPAVRPAKVLTLAQQRIDVVEWAASPSGPGEKRLLKELQYLLG